MKKFIIFAIVPIVVVVLAIIFIILAFPKKHIGFIDLYSEKYSLSKAMVASVINIESGFDIDCVSKAGAIGLMQLLPSTAEDCANRLNIEFQVGDLKEPKTNIELGCFYLSYLLDLFEGNEVNALSAYNWGLGNVNKWILEGNVDDSGTIKDIPVEETRNYIKKYNLNYFVYSRIYKLE